MADSLRPTTAVIPFHSTPAPPERQGEARHETLAATAAPLAVTQLLHIGMPAWFPLPPYDAVYEIAIRGVCEFSVRACTGLISSETNGAEADALRVEESGWSAWQHDWLWINDHTLRYLLDYEDAEILEADYGSHTYRFRIHDPGKQLKVEFIVPGRIEPRGSRGERRHYGVTGDLTVTVQALPPGALTSKQRRKVQKDAERRTQEQNNLASTPKPPEKPPENDDSYRERWLRNVDRSSEDMTAFLERVHTGREKQLAQLAAMNLDPETDTYRQYKSEIDNWTAKQIMQFTERKGGDHGSATVIG